MPVVIDLLKATVALFIIIDPVGLVPIFMALTRHISHEEQIAIFTRAIAVAFILLVIFALAGTGILNLFGITINDFKIAGGILLLVLALHIINEAHYAQEGESNVGVVPLAVPLLAGPGAITTTIVFIATYGVWITIGALVITFALTFIIFRYVGLFYRLLGQTGSDVIAKIMGMLLAAIAVQFIRQGLQGMLHF